MTLTQVNEAITAEVIKALENGVIPWRKPWVCSNRQYADPRVMPVSYATGKPYSISNQWLIMLSKHGAGEYATFKHIRENGGTVKKGEHGATVFVFSAGKPQQIIKDGKPVLNIDGTPKTFTPWFARAYKVFNVYTQCEGIAPKWLQRAIDEDNTLKDKTAFTPHEQAENLISAYLEREKVVMSHGGDMAYFNTLTDNIVVPQREAFITARDYYLTAFHEITHSTGVKKRLNREMGGRTFFGPTENYGREELVAEMGAAFAVTQCGIEADIESVAGYCKCWRDFLKSDNGAIMYAAKQAQRAAHYIATGEKNASNATERDEQKAA